MQNVCMFVQGCSTEALQHTRPEPAQQGLQPYNHSAALDQCRPFSLAQDRDQGIWPWHSYLAIAAPPGEAMNLDTGGNLGLLFRATGKAGVLQEGFGLSSSSRLCGRGAGWDMILPIV